MQKIKYASNMKRFLSLLILSGNFATTSAGLVEDSGWWAQTSGNVNLSHLDPALQNFRLAFDGQARFFDDFGRFSQGLIRLMPGYQIHKNISLYIGYTWLPTDLPNRPTVHEHDINQAISWFVLQGWGRFSGRTMLEERFIEKQNQVGVRIRQKFRADYPLVGLSKQLKLIVWDEAFFNLNSVNWGPVAGFDQNRAFAGLGWQFDQEGRYTLELGYMNLYINHGAKVDYMNHLLFTNMQFKF